MNLGLLVQIIHEAKVSLIIVILYYSQREETF